MEISKTRDVSATIYASPSNIKHKILNSELYQLTLNHSFFLLEPEEHRTPHEKQAKPARKIRLPSALGHPKNLKGKDQRPYTKLDYRPPPSSMALSRVPGDEDLYVGGYVDEFSLHSVLEVWHVTHILSVLSFSF